VAISSRIGNGLRKCQKLDNQTCHSTVQYSYVLPGNVPVGEYSLLLVWDIRIKGNGSEQQARNVT
jgi:hypothetical protein